MFPIFYLLKLRGLLTMVVCGWYGNNFSGYICLSLPPSRLKALQLPPSLPPSGVSQDPKGTAYHLTVDSAPGRHPVSTGISAHDRAYTARLLADPNSDESDFTRPGHMVTLRYAVGGVRKRRGHTECATGTFIILFSLFLFIKK